MINNELINEMITTLEDTESRLYYLEHAMRQPLSDVTRCRAEMQQVIFKQEIAEINYLLEAEYMEMDIGKILMQIFVSR